MFHLLKLTWRYAGPDKRRMVLFYALCVGANLTAATIPLVLEQLINGLTRPGANLWHELIVWSALLWCITAIFWSMHGPSRIIERRVAFNIYQRYIRSLYKRVMDMPLRWHQDHHSGATLDRVSKSSKALFQFAQIQFMMIEITIRYIGSLIFLGWLCWWLSLLVIAFSVVVIVVVRRLDRKLIELVHQTNEKEHRLSAALYDYVGNIVSVLTLRLGGRTREEIDSRFAAMRPPFFKQVVDTERKWFSLSLLVSFMRAGTLALYMAVTVQSGSVIVIGTLVAIFQYLGYINEAFFAATSYADRVLQLGTDAHAVDGIEADYAALPPKPERHEAALFEKIEIQGLTFAHQEDERDNELHTLTDVALSIEAGQKIAIIGTSGAGKTTLLTLLRGLYDAKDVRLTLDGQSFDSLLPLAAFTTLIPQDAEIFENTIRHNLTMGIEVPDVVLYALLDMVKLTSLIESLPNGLETDIRERGVNLSGGQKQRLALARGLLAGRDSALLLLDEPTSNVDLTTEEHIFTGLFESYADKAIIASLHRLHLLPRFDRVIVMENGRVVQQGSFDELVAKHGPLRTIWHQHVVEKR